MFMEIMWLLFMVGAVAVTLVVALRERRARHVAERAMRPAVAEPPLEGAEPASLDDFAAEDGEAFEFNPDEFK